jgi:hypothetical protein
MAPVMDQARAADRLELALDRYAAGEELMVLGHSTS